MYILKVIVAKRNEFSVQHQWTPLVLLVCQSHCMLTSAVSSAAASLSRDFTLQCTWMCHASAPECTCVYSSSGEQVVWSGAQEPWQHSHLLKGCYELFSDKLQKNFSATRKGEKFSSSLAKMSGEQKRPSTLHKKPADHNVSSPLQLPCTCP